MPTYPIRIIVGPTASGKSAAAVRLALEYPERKPEIISADARQVYEGFDVATGKITAAEAHGIPHHGIGIAACHALDGAVAPTYRYTAHDWKAFAMAKIEDILARGGWPIIVGGTGLYINALLLDYGMESDKEALTKGVFPYEVEITYLKPDRKQLYERINARVVSFFESGLLEETKELLEKYPHDALPFTGIGYEEAVRVLAGAMTRDEAIASTQQRSRHYAKRQFTWFNNQIPKYAYVKLEIVK